MNERKGKEAKKKAEAPPLFPLKKGAGFEIRVMPWQRFITVCRQGKKVHKGYKVHYIQKRDKEEE